MDEPTIPKRRFSKRKRAILITIPFLLLLLCLGSLNIWARSVVQATPPTPNKITAVVTNTDTIPSVTPTVANTELTDSDSALPTIAATAAPPPTASPIPLPTLPPTATIILFGPPDQSRIMTEDNITVYWTWPLPLTEDQYFGIYLQEETGESRIGRIEEANFGTGYRWQTEAQYLTDDGGEVRYLIKLETILSDTPLIMSEPRTLFILK